MEGFVWLETRRRLECDPCQSTRRLTFVDRLKLPHQTSRGSSFGRLCLVKSSHDSLGSKGTNKTMETSDLAAGDSKTTNRRVRPQEYFEQNRDGSQPAH